MTVLLALLLSNALTPAADTALSLIRSFQSSASFFSKQFIIYLHKHVFLHHFSSFYTSNVFLLSHSLVCREAKVQVDGRHSVSDGAVLSGRAYGPYIQDGVRQPTETYVRIHVYSPLCHLNLQTRNPLSIPFAHRYLSVLVIGRSYRKN